MEEVGHGEGHGFLTPSPEGSQLWEQRRANSLLNSHMWLTLLMGQG